MTTLLVTVGSTNFRALTDAVFAHLPQIAALGVAHLIVQLGNARVPELHNELDVNGANSVKGEAEGHFSFADSTRPGSTGQRQLKVTVIRYTADADAMDRLIDRADGVVSHAGSGTILAVLRRPRKPAPRLLVVPNASLMDNHQQELADALHAQGYLDVCTTDTLLDALHRMFDASAPEPTPFPPHEPSRFAAILDEVAGFA